MLWYVVQVRTGEERDIAAKLTDMGFQTLAPVENRPVRSGGAWGTKDLCEIKTLFVDGGQRGRGYGRRLLGRALSFAAQSGYRRAALDTRAQDTAAIALYKSVGFYETTPYHDNPYADIFMELIL